MFRTKVPYFHPPFLLPPNTNLPQKTPIPKQQQLPFQPHQPRQSTPTLTHPTIQHHAPPNPLQPSPSPTPTNPLHQRRKHRLPTPHRHLLRRGPNPLRRLGLFQTPLPTTTTAPRNRSGGHRAGRNPGRGRTHSRNGRRSRGGPGQRRRSRCRRRRELR